LIKSSLRKIGFAAVLLCGLPISNALAGGLAGSYLAGMHATRMDHSADAAQYFSRALAYAPNDIRILDLAIMENVAAGQVARALPLAKRMLLIEPTHLMSNMVTIADMFRQKKYAEAANYFETEEQNGFNTIMRQLMYGWALSGQGKHEEAAAEFAKLQDRPLLNLFGSYHSALMWSIAGDAEKAEIGFADAISAAETTTSRLANAYGRLLRREGRNDSAIGLYNTVLDIDPQDVVIQNDLKELEEGIKPDLLINDAHDGVAEALYGFSGALAQDNSNRFSMLYLQLATFIKPDFTNASLLMGNLLDSQGHWDQAIRAFDKIPTDNPLYKLAQIGKASSLNSDEKPDDAFAVLDKLNTQYPDDIGIIIAQADLQHRNERYALCGPTYEKAISLVENIESNYWSLFYSVGICFERAKIWDKAEANFLKALELEPDQPEVLNYLGYSWIEKNMHIEEAKDMIEKAVMLKPDSGYITDSLGWVLYKMEEFEEAVKHLERAVELLPTDPIVNDHYGDALWNVGRKHEAVFQWKRALSFGPEADEIKRIEQKLDIGLDAVLIEENGG